MPSLPWAFTDTAVESEYKQYVIDSLLDRSNAFIWLNLCCAVLLNSVACLCIVLFDMIGKGNYTGIAGIATRVACTSIAAILFFVKWADRVKPKSLLSMCKRLW